LTSLPKPKLTTEVKNRLTLPAKKNGGLLSKTTPNPSVEKGQYRSTPEKFTNGNGNGNTLAKASSGRRYFSATDDGEDWPPEMQGYNRNFAEALDKIKRRHDSVVTTMGEFSSSCGRLEH
jgi:pyruvate dehydrogenase kinase 2/3/4